MTNTPSNKVLVNVYCKSRIHGDDNESHIFLNGKQLTKWSKSGYTFTAVEAGKTYYVQWKVGDKMILMDQFTGVKEIKDQKLSAMTEQ